MAYRVRIPENLSGFHDVLHVSHLRKCLHDTTEFIESSVLEEVEVEQKATVRRVPTRILGSKVKKLRNKEIILLKVQWGDNPEDATWETEDKIRASYPFLFEGMFLTPFPKFYLCLFLSIKCIISIVFSTFR